MKKVLTVADSFALKIQNTVDSVPQMKEICCLNKWDLNQEEKDLIHKKREDKTVAEVWTSEGSKRKAIRCSKSIRMAVRFTGVFSNLLQI